MRTTLALEDDVLEQARAVAARLHAPFRRVVNEALRAGLGMIKEPPPAQAYRTRPHKMGLKAGRNMDNIQELLAQVEGEDHR